MMRWLYLINALAIVILAGAVAIALEGTRFAEAPPAADATDSSVIPSDEVPHDEALSISTDDGPLEDTEVALVPDEAQLELAPTSEELGDPAPDAPVPVGRPGRTDAPLIAEAPDEPKEPQAVNVEEEVETLPDIAPPAAQRERQLLTVATEGDFPPFNFVDAEGNPAGFDVKITEALCEAMAADCTVRTVPWDQLGEILLSGEVDAIIASQQISASHGPGISFSDPYYGTSGRYLFPAGGEVAQPEQGAEVHVQKDSSHAAYLRTERPDLNLVPEDNLADVIAAVREGGIGFGDNATLMRILQEEACCLRAGDRVVDTRYFGVGAGIATRSSSEGLREAFNQALQTILADGSYQRISEEYFAANIY